MIDNIENTFQIIILLICTAVAIYKAAVKQSRIWTLLAFFYGSWVLGDIYWLICLIFFNHVPKVSVVSDLSWYASYIFLYMLLRYTDQQREAKEKNFLPWLGAIFAAGMAVFFMQWGEIINNLIYASLMGLLLFSIIRRLQDRERNKKQYPLCVIAFIFCLQEYALWISSCLFSGDNLQNLYYWFDFLLTFSFLFFLPATGKAVES